MSRQRTLLETCYTKLSPAIRKRTDEHQLTKSEHANSYPNIALRYCFKIFFYGATDRTLTGTAEMAGGF